MAEGETLYDILDGLQRGGVLPRDDSWLFHGMFAASRIPVAAQAAWRRLRAKA